MIKMKVRMNNKELGRFIPGEGVEEVGEGEEDREEEEEEEQLEEEEFSGNSNTFQVRTQV